MGTNKIGDSTFFYDSILIYKSQLKVVRFLFA